MVLNVLDRSGTILTHYPDRGAWVGQTIMDTPIFNAIREKHEGTVELNGVDGVMRSYTFTGVKGSSGDLFVNVGVAKRAALAPVMRALYLKLAALLAIGVSVFLAVWISSVFLVARPVGMLVDTTRRLAEGDLNTRSRLSGGPREMMELAHSFDQMAESLERQERDRQDTHARLLQYDRQLRGMTVELSLAEEQERRQIAAQLHDNVGPLLATAFIKLGRAMEFAVPERAETILRDVRQHVDQSIQLTQTVTFDLSSPLLYTLGLLAALEQLCQDFAADHPLVVEFRGDERARDLPSDQRVILYRATRELLCNVVKHAEAEHVTVVCACGEREVSVTVKDDGVGFDAGQVGQGFSRTGGFGLFNLQERFTYLGGRFVVESSKGGGTQAVVALPVSSAKQKSEAET
ncbi:MAG: HAMP domain-containing protein [Verrucomicrobia bacterium]|nr:HAMP domain-containing protein [Verrucomicrobiota bacterium]